VVVRRLAAAGGSFVLPSDGSAVAGVAFSPDGRRIALWSKRDFRIWDVDSRRFSLAAVGVPEEQMIRRVGFSADGRLALLECEARSDQLEKRVRLYLTADGQPVGSTIAFFAEESSPVALNAPGTLLLTVEDDHVAKIRSTFNGQCLAAWSHNGKVSEASFSRDGHRVLLSCRDGTVRKWELGFDATVPIAQRAIEFEVRSGATLTLEGDVRALSLAEWESRRRELLREEIRSGKALDYLGAVHPLSAAP
jgi:WD40 repeat protein